MTMDRIVLRFSPATDVTDLDEWFATLDRAVSLGNEGIWEADSRSVRVEVPVEHADEMLQSVRGTLGEAVVVSSGNEPLVLDAEGAPIDR